MGKYTKTKRYTRETDQILHEDMGSEKSLLALTNQPLDEFKPGMGQFYCIPCSKYFETDHARQHHYRGKVHKRRVKDIAKGPYTPEEADMAAGHNINKYISKQQLQTSIQSEAQVQSVLQRHKPLHEVQKESEMELETQAEGMDEGKTDSDLKETALA